MDNLAKKLDEFFMDRICSNKEGMSESELKEYESAEDKCKEMYDAIEEMLPDNGKKMLFEMYDIIENNMNSVVG